MTDSASVLREFRALKVDVLSINTDIRRSRPQTLQRSRRADATERDLTAAGQRGGAEGDALGVSGMRLIER